MDSEVIGSDHKFSKFLGKTKMTLAKS
jgi:hypothetical protein